MGTRADFYIGRGEGAQWLGSIAWDGYPDGINLNGDEMVPMWEDGPIHRGRIDWPEGAHLFDATTEADFSERLARFFQYRDDVTLPERGWPWPWEDSRTTDYAYALDDGVVYGSCFGGKWFVAREGQSDEDDDDDEAVGGHAAVFPQMKTDRNPPIGSKQSGLMVLGL